MNRIILNETSYFGAGCRSVIAVEAARRGFKKAFFVTDKDLIKFGVAAEIIKVFDENQIPYELYSDVKANPTIANVQNGVAAYKASGADFIVALGGGSSIDTAKGIGIVVNNPDFADVKSLEGVADTKHKAVPTFALPTTAGTAAEVTINYVIIDEDARKKMVCVDPNDIPAVAIVDPELMYSMPKGLTAATGMDALTHAIESYITPGAWVMSDMFELKAIEMIAQNLKAAVDNGKDVAAREAMSQAQYIAGTSHTTSYVRFLLRSQYGVPRNLPPERCSFHSFLPETKCVPAPLSHHSHNRFLRLSLLRLPQFHRGSGAQPAHILPDFPHLPVFPAYNFPPHHALQVLSSGLPRCRCSPAHETAALCPKSPAAVSPVLYTKYRIPMQRTSDFQLLCTRSIFLP